MSAIASEKAKRVVVTGGSGKAGRAVVKDLRDHGWEVLNVDVALPREPQGVFTRADLTEFGQAMEAVGKIDGRFGGPPDAVVHLAAIPASGLWTNSETFRVNMLSTYNVFEACRQWGVKNVVWASSETVLGLPFDEPPPYMPVDEEYRGRPESAYSLSKWLGEEMAEQFCRWDKALKIVGLRFSNIMEEADYARFPSFEKDVRSRKWNLWGYIDARDAAAAVRLSLEAKITGAHVLVIANADTVMTRSNDALLADVFPGVQRKREFAANETLLSIEKARKLIGFEPKHSWRAR